MKINGIKETVIYVSDLAKTKAFYEELFLLKSISYVENKHLFFKIGNSMLLIFNPENSKNKTDIPSHYAHGEQHFAFEVDQDEYAEWKKRISSFVEIEHEQKWKNNTYSFYFRDPENNSLEIVMKGIWGD